MADAPAVAANGASEWAAIDAVLWWLSESDALLGLLLFWLNPARRPIPAPAGQ